MGEVKDDEVIVTRNSQNTVDQAGNLPVGKEQLEASIQLLNKSALILLKLRGSAASHLGMFEMAHGYLRAGKAIKFGDNLLVYEKEHTYPDGEEFAKDRCFRIGEGENSVTLITGYKKDGAMSGMYLNVDGEEYHIGIPREGTGNFNYIEGEIGGKNVAKVEKSDNSSDPVEAAILLEGGKVRKSYHTYTTLFERGDSLGPQAIETPESLAKQHPDQLEGFARALGEMSPSNSPERVTRGYFDYNKLINEMMDHIRSQKAEVVDKPA